MVERKQKQLQFSTNCFATTKSDLNCGLRPSNYSNDGEDSSSNMPAQKECLRSPLCDLFRDNADSFIGELSLPDSPSDSPLFQPHHSNDYFEDDEPYQNRPEKDRNQPELEGLQDQEEKSEGHYQSQYKLNQPPGWQLPEEEEQAHISQEEIRIEPPRYIKVDLDKLLQTPNIDRSQNVVKHLKTLLLKHLSKYKKLFVGHEKFYRQFRKQLRSSKDNYFGLNKLKKVLGQDEPSRLLRSLPRLAFRKMLNKWLRRDILQSNHIKGRDSKRTYLITTKVFSLRCMNELLSTRMAMR